jgi:hypothetical protein
VARPRCREAGRRERREYRLNVTLGGIRSRTWRQYLLPVSVRVDEAHDVLLWFLRQRLMGWCDCHLCMFRTREAMWVPNYAEIGKLRGQPELRCRQRHVLRYPRDWMLYEYGFGDDCVHRIEPKAMRPIEAGVDHPHVVAWRRACPPEDVGGTVGHTDFRKATAIRYHPEHTTSLESCGGHFDPGAFDAKPLNDTMPFRRNAGWP